MQTRFPLCKKIRKQKKVVWIQCLTHIYIKICYLYFQDPFYLAPALSISWIKTWGICEGWEYKNVKQNVKKC